MRTLHAGALASVVALVMAAGPVAAADFRPLNEWRAYNGTGVPPTWTISGDTISYAPGGGDLVSVKTFRNFELSFEWQLAPGGNSGVIYRVDEADGAPFQSGPEYQILDNAGHEDGRNPLTSAGSDYGIYAPSADVTKPVGDWNTVRIVVSGDHVEHWLNGTKVLEYDLGSADWKARVAASKFAAWPQYGTVARGHIDLQDHGDPVAFRHVMIRELPD